MKKLYTLLISALLATTTLTGATITVTSNANSGAGTLRQAIADAADGDEIVFSLSAGNETIVIASELAISDKSISIDGSNTAGSGTRVTVQVTEPGVSNWRVFKICACSKEVNISNMTIKGGDISGNEDIETGSGGGILLFGGILTLDTVTISGSKAYYGGGFCSSGVDSDGNLACTEDNAPNFCYLNNLNIVDCEAIVGGGIMGAFTFSQITGSNISRNKARFTGGGIYSIYYHYSLIINSTICENVSNTDGPIEWIPCGGVMTDSKTSTILLNSTISGNRIEGTGETGAGGIVMNSDPNYLLLSNSIIINNTGKQADDIYQMQSDYNKIWCYNSWYNPAKVVLGNFITQANSPNVTNTFTTGDLEALANNGGGTETMAINLTSPAYRTGGWLFCNDTDGYYIQGTDNNYYQVVACMEILPGFLHYYIADPNYTQVYPANPEADRITNDQRGKSRTPVPDIGAYQLCELTWQGSQNTQWHNALNWDRGFVPDNAWDAIIPNVAGDPVISSEGNATCRDLIVNSGASLTVESGGSLITNGSITGSVVVERTISDGQWHLVSSPITNATANTFFGEYLQTWSEPLITWSNIENPATNLEVAKGYSLWGIAKGNHTYTFTGTPNTGSLNTTVTFTEYSTDPNANEGANLLGNPYPSSIDWSGLDDIWGAVYYWDATANDGDGDYLEWNNNTGSGSQFIPPMQGFFIVTNESNTTEGSGTFTLTNANRTHSGATSFYKSKINNGIVIVATNGIKTDELFIRFDNNATEDFDLPFDAVKFLTGADGVGQIFSFGNNRKLAIDVRPQTQTIQLGFANNQAGIYTIALKEIADIPNATLEDTKTNTFHNLQNGAYQFAWELGDDEKRFKLHLNSVGIEETPGSESDILIYAANGQIFVKGAGNGEMMVSDMMGRVVLWQEIHGNETISIPVNLNTGVYLVTVLSGMEVKTEKIFVK